MSERWFTLETLADVVVTRNGTTTGAQETLDYIPGSAILGAIVAGCGIPFDPGLFLSGRLRCSDACPLAGDTLAWPIPLCFHKPKGALDEEACSAVRQEVVAGEQLREGYLTASGQRVFVATTFRMKTAIDRERRGVAADGQLFGYEAIAAGQLFAFRVTMADREAEAAVSRALRGMLRIGRSKSAEYGLVRITERSTPAGLSSVPPPDGVVVLYLVSDVCLASGGSPVLSPQAQAFGLPASAGADLKRCFVRTRAYSPWNAFYRRRMTERQVLCRGSVLTFDSRAEGMPSGLVTRLAEGVGLFVEEGLGVVALNPAFIVNPLSVRSSISKSARAGAGSLEAPAHPLAAFMQSQAAQMRAEPEALELAQTWARELLGIADRLQKDEQVVPSKSQWSFVRQLAVRSDGSAEGLRKLLEQLKEDSRAKWWTATVRANGRDVSLHGEILHKLGVAPSDAVRRLALMHAAVAVVRNMDKQESKR